MVSQMLSGDIGGPTFGLYEYGVHPWDDWDLYRRHSPLTYADQVTHPAPHPALGEGPALHDHPGRGAVRGPALAASDTVRLMRVPDESHELTRSGTPFRRVDNLRLIDEWFRHFLVDGRTRLPRIDPKRG